MHRATQAGIAGGEADGVDSIVVSGGYEDDEDSGDVIVYTGQGGNDPATKKQIADQTLTLGNAGLMKSRVQGLPVRVIRGADAGSPFAPAQGYRYDGLYYVEDAHHRIGKSGYNIWQFTLRRDDAASPPWAAGPTPSAAVPTSPVTPAPRTQVTVLRIIRNTAMARKVKELHGYRCQFCDLRLEMPTGLYAEGAHIRPLGAPHRGPDTVDNILCLCPNHHLLFDVGAVTIADDLSLIGMPGTMRTSPKHQINLEYVRYHRVHYAPSE